MDHAPSGGVSAPTATNLLSADELAAVEALRRFHDADGRIAEPDRSADTHGGGGAAGVNGTHGTHGTHGSNGSTGTTGVTGANGVNGAVGPIDPAVLADLTRAAATVDVTDSGAATDEADAPGCPMPAFIRGSAGSCPVMAGQPADGVRRSRADLFMRKLLRIQDPPADRSEAEANRHFRRSMTISGIRCTLTYVIFPIVLPLFSFLQGVGPFIGVTVGSIALVFDTLTVRRFFAVDHRFRWQFSAIAGAVMVLLVILLVQDGMELGRHLLG